MWFSYCSRTAQRATPQAKYHLLLAVCCNNLSILHLFRAGSELCKVVTARSRNVAMVTTLWRMLTKIDTPVT